MGIETTRFSTRTDAHVRNNYQMLKWEQRISETSQLHLKVSRDSAETHSDNKNLSIEGGNVEVDVQHSFALGKRHQIVWGANYKNSEAQSNLLRSRTEHDDLFGFFLQKTQRWVRWQVTWHDSLPFFANGEIPGVCKHGQKRRSLIYQQRRGIKPFPQTRRRPSST